MSGIYFHIPFCKQACHYCNFHFSTILSSRDDMIAALIKEIHLNSSILANDEKVETIYFGGGTPSLLNLEEIEILLEITKQKFSVNEFPEITLEANPDDINERNLQDWKVAGVNRLSIGIQSFKDEDLQWMNRVHNAKQAFDCLTLVNNAGFTNYSVDLIYGTPTLEDDEWKKNVDTAIGLKVPHVSCYALTVEPATALQKMIERKAKEDIDHEKQARQFLLLMNWMKTGGYEHYEISNFAIPGFRSRHNSNYWSGKSYIGIGPSAHSYFGKIRRWNISNNALYIKSLENNSPSFEQEELSQTQQLNEYIMTSLRTLEGLDLKFVKEKFGEEKSIEVLKGSCRFQQNNKIRIIDQKIILTNEGKLFADGIASDLFFNPI